MRNEYTCEICGKILSRSTKSRRCRKHKVFTKQHRKNLGKAHKGLLTGDKNPMFGKGLFGKDNGMYNKHHSKEAKDKIRHNIPNQFGKNNHNWKGGKTRKSCLNCHKKFLSYKSTNRKFCSLKCSYIYQNNHRCPENHWNWQGGKSFEEYPKEFNYELKERIRKRDNYICQKCFVIEEYLSGKRKKLVVHHIDYNKQNYDEKNLIVLCHRCNSKVERNKEYWKKYFQNNINNYYFYTIGNNVIIP